MFILYSPYYHHHRDTAKSYLKKFNKMQIYIIASQNNLGKVFDKQLKYEKSVILINSKTVF